MTRQIVILAAGDGSRWNGGIKELALFDGEPLLLRTVRICKIYERSIFIATHKPEIWAHADKFTVLIPMMRRYTVETLLSTSNLWREQNVILLGDVYYSSGLLQQIINDDSKISIYGDASEIQALCFAEGGRQEIIEAAGRVQLAVETGNRGCLRELYHCLIGLPADQYQHGPYILGDHYVRTDGRAFDIDSPEMHQHAVQWLAAHPIAGSFKGLYKNLSIRKRSSSADRHHNRESK